MTRLLKSLIWFPHILSRHCFSCFCENLFFFKGRFLTFLSTWNCFYLLEAESRIAPQLSRLKYESWKDIVTKHISCHIKTHRYMYLISMKMTWLNSKNNQNSWLSPAKVWQYPPQTCCSSSCQQTIPEDCWFNTAGDIGRKGGPQVYLCVLSDHIAGVVRVLLKEVELSMFQEVLAVSVCSRCQSDIGTKVVNQY